MRCVAVRMGMATRANSATRSDQSEQQRTEQPVCVEGLREEGVLDKEHFVGALMDVLAPAPLWIECCADIDSQFDLSFCKMIIGPRTLS